MDATKHNRWSPRSVILVVASFLAAMSSGAVAQKQKDVDRAIANMQDPSKSLWITVESVPSGAIVYGVSNGQPATRLGTTPITLKYARAGRWIFASSGSSLEETLDFKEEDSALWSKSKSFLAFRCIVVKDGYRPYRMNHVIEDRSSTNVILPSFGHIKSLDGGVQRTFTAFLDPIAPLIESPAPQRLQQPQQPEQQQQQQQQQQTVVVPGSEDIKKQTGTVIVSCNVQSAEVYVDGLFVGNAPATLKLREGVHIIEVKESGYSSYRKELRVFADSDVSLRVELTKGGKSND